MPIQININVHSSPLAYFHMHPPTVNVYLLAFSWKKKSEEYSIGVRAFEILYVAGNRVIVSGATKWLNLAWSNSQQQPALF